jgi:hypothetical protein
VDISLIESQAKGVQRGEIQQRVGATPKQHGTEYSLGLADLDVALEADVEWEGNASRRERRERGKSGRQRAR